MAAAPLIRPYRPEDRTAVALVFGVLLSVLAARAVAVPDRDTLTARAATIEQRFGLPARKWLRMVRPWQP